MMHISSCDQLKEEFMSKYSKDFDITGGGLMKTFLRMEVEQNDEDIKLHLDHYIQTVLAEYRDYIKKALRPKKVPISPGVTVVLHPEQAPAVRDRHKQKYYRSFVAKLQFAATRARMDISFTASQLAYPIQKITEIYNKVTEMYKKVTELEISSWNVLSLLRSEVAYIGTGHILP